MILNRKIKRLLSVLLCLALCVSLLPAAVFATEDEPLDPPAEAAVTETPAEPEVAEPPDEPAFANDEARAAVASLYRYWQAAAACVGA